MNNFLAITYAFMLGFCPYDNTGMNKTKECFEDATHVQFELGVDVCDTFRIYAGEETLQTMDGSIFSWFPYTQSYTIGAEYHKEVSEKLSVIAGVNHKCQHPMSAWDVKPSTLDSARTEVYIKLSGKVDIF